MVDICYPEGTDWSCAYTPEEIADLNQTVKERSEALAWSTLSALTGFRLSLCPSLIRPCAARCNPQTWETAPVTWDGSGSFSPFISGGRWFNGCGCSSARDCSCSSMPEVILPAEVGDITTVTLDGAVLDPSAYRVDNGTHLVRLDGEVWPACNDGSFIVEYYPGVAPNDLFRFAAGVLANEYYLACSGKDCRLPNGVTNIVRSGMSMTVQTGLFSDGLTGITEVDAVIRTYNPYALKGPSRVLSPDRPRGRVQTWRP